MDGNTKLTPKQEKFCLKYLECGNASEAYRYAYACGKMKSATINSKAYELLSNGVITVRVKELQQSTQQQSELTKERILKELSAIIESKITDYVELKNDGLKFKDFGTLTEPQVRAIESVKQGKHGIELRLHGKSWSIERICKMLGYEAPAKHEISTGIMDLSRLSDDELNAYYALIQKAREQ